MSSVTGVLMRRGTELAVTHMQLSDNIETKQPHGALVALFVVIALLLSFAFWAVSDNKLSLDTNPLELTSDRSSIPTGW